MKVAIASDHRGVRVKGQILAQLEELGHTGLDFGPEETKSVDYPDFAFKVAEAVATGAVERGILICGTGMGMCIAANKFAGVRAVTCHDDVTAEYSRRHNNANVMCLSADMLGDRLLARRPPQPKRSRPRRLRASALTASVGEFGRARVFPLLASRRGRPNVEFI
jgi:ribose 5-phosphate isomerase B